MRKPPPKKRRKTKRPTKEAQKRGLLDGLPLGSSVQVKENKTGGLDAFVIRAYPGDDPSENR